MYICVHVRTFVLVLDEAHVQWNKELEQVLLLGGITVSLTFPLLMFTTVIIMVGIKVFGLGILEREYRDCIKSRRDKIKAYLMHQVLYIHCAVTQ